jgi:hypothetical protein
MAQLQERLYAQDRWSVLLIFQAMDAAGKDGTIKHVMTGLNPRGCEAHSFKAPSSEELDHDFLWRTSNKLPRRGHIGIFNRSYYEEMLVVRVHPEILGRQQLPAELVTPRIWKERFEDVVSYERYLSRQGVVIRKFFLYVSPESSAGGSSSGSPNPTNTGSSRSATCTNVSSSTTTSPPTTTSSGTPHHRSLRGTSCPRITSGSRASSWPPPSSKRSNRCSPRSRRWMRRRCGS